jgi:phosphatidylglycerophosphate synthase
MAVLKAFRRSRYGKWLAAGVVGLIACTLLIVAAGEAGSVWLTVLLGVLAYAALVGILTMARRMARARQRERIGTYR